MRVPKLAMVIVGFALWCGLAPAPSLAQAAVSSRGSQILPPTQAMALAQASPPAPPPPQYSADGLYNLANSYARAGKPGLAVLNYERAALMAPDDADINANLEYVRASAHVRTEPRSHFARVVLVVSPASAAWIGVLGIALVGSGLLARKMTPGFRWVCAGGFLLGVALISLSASSAVLLWPRMHEGI